MVMQRHRLVLTSASALAAAALVATVGSIPSAQASSHASQRRHPPAAAPRPQIHSVLGGVNVTWPKARYATTYRVKFAPAPWDAWPRQTRLTRWSPARSVTWRVPTNAASDASMTAIPYANPVFAQVFSHNPYMKSRSRKSKWLMTFPQVPAPAAGIPMRIGTYNVRLGSNAEPQQGGTPWPQRYPQIAANIASQHLDVVALQEIFQNSNRTFGSDDVVRALRADTGEPWAAVGVKGDEGRIIYNSAKFTLLTSGSVAVTSFTKSTKTPLPYAILAPNDDNGSPIRDAAFLLVSAHFVPSAIADGKHLAAVNRQTGQNARELLADLARVKDSLASDRANADLADAPQIIAGDYTSGNLNYGDLNPPQPTFVRAGFYDAMAAQVKVGYQWQTVNKLVYPQPRAKSGVGTRADGIFMRGIVGATYYRNVANFRGSLARQPSDHNLVWAAIQLPDRTPPAP